MFCGTPDGLLTYVNKQFRELTGVGLLFPRDRELESSSTSRAHASLFSLRSFTQIRTPGRTSFVLLVRPAISSNLEASLSPFFFKRLDAASTNVGGGETRRSFLLVAFVSLTSPFSFRCSASERGSKALESSSSRPGWVARLVLQFADTSLDLLFLVSLSAPFLHPDVFHATTTDTYIPPFF